jgi:hypothetical protein
MSQERGSLSIYPINSDDIGAKIREKHARERCRTQTRKFHHAVTCQRPAHALADISVPIAARMPRRTISCAHL